MELYGMMKQDVLEKLYHFCAYQERCIQDVTKKLNKLEIPTKNHQEYIDHLQQERFLNEERFVSSYIKGKLRSNHWGKRKIKFQLQQKGINEELILTQMEQLPDETYREIALTEAQKKWNKTKAKSDWEKQQKVFAYLAQKGFEFDIIKDVMEDIT